MIRRVAVAVSGGVDSSVAAALLKDRGFDLQGVFMKNWDILDETGVCSAEDDYRDARIVCDRLKIPLIRVDFVKQYWNEVFLNLVKGYEAGLTPNPDILCNRNVKFKSFYEHCRNHLGVDAIATGHYANTSFGPFLEKYEDNARVKLLRPLDSSKDQTFFLSQVRQDALCRTMFPVATLKKTMVRKIAKERGLPVYNKRDSYGICFVGKRPFQQFIAEYISAKPGNFIDIETGKVVGSHNGAHNWTVGQRCRLSGYNICYCILKKDLKDNNIYVVPGSHHPALYSKIFITKSPHWINEEPDSLKHNNVFECYFRFQHVLPLTKCRVIKVQSGLLVNLQKPMRALTPGQYAAFYDGNECFGSAQILHAGPSLYFSNF